MEIIDNIPVWGAPVDEAALKQIKTCYYIFGQAAMMADHHKGYGVPIGGHRRYRHNRRRNDVAASGPGPLFCDSMI
jgi:tRNA-splicing ligase RtcB